MSNETTTNVTPTPTPKNPAILRDLVRAGAGVCRGVLVTGTVAMEMVADGIDLIPATARATPKVGKQLLLVPFDAATGVIAKSEGITHEEAEKRSYAILNQELAVSIKKGSIASGEVLADMWAE